MPITPARKAEIAYQVGELLRQRTERVAQIEGIDRTLEAYRDEAGDAVAIPVFTWPKAPVIVEKVQPGGSTYAEATAAVNAKPKAKKPKAKKPGTEDDPLGR